jgi:hypothetical protein
MNQQNQNIKGINHQLFQASTNGFNNPFVTTQNQQILQNNLLPTD